MIKYAKIINQETKQCDVGLGTNAEFYKSIGMSEMDVEQAYNGAWYLKGYAPEKSEEEINSEKKALLISQLDALDLKCIRSLRAIQAGVSTDEDVAKLAELEEQAAEVRKQLKELE